MFNLAQPNRRSSLVVVFLILVLGLIKFSFLQTNILSYDYFGLYLYLPATYFHHKAAILDLFIAKYFNTYDNDFSLIKLYLLMLWFKAN